MATNAADILVVDDDRLIRTIVGDTLSAQGFAVAVAEGGEAALAQLSARDFDLVVCDLRMPGVDGFEVLRRMQLDFPDTEVIILSAHADVEAAIQCLRAGAFDLVRKEHEMMELVPAVERAIERRRLRDASSLAAAAKLIFSTSERHDLPERIVSVATKTMDADDAGLMLPDVNGQLYIAFSNVLPDEVQKTVRINVGDGIAGQVAQTRTPRLLHGPQPTHDVRAREVASSIVYPLHSGPDLLGVLTLNRSRADRRPFREQDVERAAVLASQVVLAIENQNLIKRVTAADKFTAIGQLSTAIAHEINNPVAAILASAEHVHEQLEVLYQQASTSKGDEARRLLATTGGLPGLEEMCVALRDVRDGAVRIRNVVRDLRNMVRADPTARVPFALEGAIMAAVRISTAELRSVAQVQTELDDALVVAGCSGTISQVFVNLLMNAAYALRTSGRRGGQLRLRSWREGELARMTVEDNGPGIAPNILARIFEPFFTTKPVGVGTGLGLAMCREIVAWHQGTMRVRSEVGAGTVFEINLPVLPVGTVPATLEEPSGVVMPALRPAKPRVLVVDDEAAIRRSYRRGLVDVEVVAVPGVREAIAALEEDDDFSIVLCDVIMPEQSGTALFEIVRSRFAALTERFVFITGSVGYSDIHDFLSTRAVKVLEKPIGLADLRSLVSDFARRFPRRVAG